MKLEMILGEGVVIQSTAAEVRKSIALSERVRRFRRVAQLGSLGLLALAGMSPAQGQTRYTPYTFTTFAGESSLGSADGTASAARFFNPRGVAADASGNLYLADSGNHTIRKITPGGVVTTLAGLAGSKGDADGTGDKARFNQPEGLAVDGLGNIFVADSGNNTIRMITPNRAVSTLAGVAGLSGTANGTANEARFGYPTGVAVDSAGNTYVADYSNHAVRKISPSGIVSTLAGLAGTGGFEDGPGNLARFHSPAGVAVDVAGNVYVTELGSQRVRKITPNGTVSTFAGSTFTRNGQPENPSKATLFVSPRGVAADRAGNVYVADTDSSTIRKINLNGEVSTFAGMEKTIGSVDGPAPRSRFDHPWSVAADAAGHVYVTGDNNTLRKITPEGTVSTLAGLPALFTSPKGVAVDQSGHVYVAEDRAHTIRRIAPNGVLETIAGSTGSGGTADGVDGEARFTLPNDVALDNAGVIYVADSFNQLIRKITPGGVVSTLAGGQSPVSAAPFGAPFAVAVDGAGMVYLADTFFNTVRKITPSGVVSTFAGTPPFYSGTVGGAVNTVALGSPTGVAVDRTGFVYIGDSGKHVIWRVSPSGAANIFAGSAGIPGSADGLGVEARFLAPTRVTLDDAGNVFVADTGNHTIRKISPAGVVTTLAGIPGSSGNADGAGSDARFNSPLGLAVDRDGALYVADSKNGTIRRGVPLGSNLPVTFATGKGGLHFENGQFRLRLTGLTSQGPVVISASTDLTSWTPIFTNAAAIGDLEFTDPAAGSFSKRFYRASTPSGP